MKTLRVTLADIEGAAHASTAAATSVTVSVAYSGQVVLTSGTVIPAAVKSKTLGSSGVVDFSVYASDDPVVRSEYRGFAVVVTATVRGPVGSPTTKLVRSVKPLESMGSTIQLGSLPPAEGLPAQWVTVDEVLGDFDARLDSLEDHPADHAARHATGGPDPITPASIGAVNTALPRVVGPDFDTMTTAGNFYIDAIGATNGPPGIGNGTLEVLTWVYAGSPFTIVQRYTSASAGQSGSGAGLAFQRTKYSTNTWSPWKCLVTDDDPRLLDTGWRDVKSLADPAVFDFTTTITGGSYLRWRRIGSTVHLSVRVPLAAGTVGTPADTRRLGLVNGSLADLGMPDNSYNAVGHVDLASNFMCSLTNASSLLRLDVRPIGATGNVSSSITARTVAGNVSWLTSASWPVTLPGTPA